VPIAAAISVVDASGPLWGRFFLSLQSLSAVAGRPSRLLPARPRSQWTLTPTGCPGWVPQSGSERRFAGVARAASDLPGPF